MLMFKGELMMKYIFGKTPDKNIIHIDPKANAIRAVIGESGTGKSVIMKRELQNMSDTDIVYVIDVYGEYDLKYLPQEDVNIIDVESVFNNNSKLDFNNIFSKRITIFNFSNVSRENEAK